MSVLQGTSRLQRAFGHVGKTLKSQTEMIETGDEPTVQITGNDDFGWSWKRVNLDGFTVAQGRGSLAEEALRAASAGTRSEVRPGSGSSGRQ